MHRETILITGCSSGIGHDAAFALQDRGHNIIAACRNIKDVHRLNKLGLKTIQMDLANTQSIATGFKEVLNLTGNQLDVLINNAGFGQPGALEDITTEVLHEQFATNVFGLMELTRLAIPVMRLQKQGRIINISSLLGFINMPFRGAYNASKHAVEALSDTLRLELKPSGIHVITIQPGPIASQFRDTAVEHSLKKLNVERSYFQTQYLNMFKTFSQQKKDSVFTQSTSAVIKKLIHAIEATNPKAKYPVTVPTHVLGLLKRLLTVKMMDRILAAISKKELQK